MAKWDCRCGLEPTKIGTSPLADGAEQGELRTGEGAHQHLWSIRARLLCSRVTSYGDIGHWQVSVRVSQKLLAAQY